MKDFAYDVQVIEHYLHLLGTKGHKVPDEVRSCMARLYHRAFVVQDDYAEVAERAQRVDDARNGFAEED